jgi:hypothetical protein
MSKISLIINADTRRGADAPTTRIGEFGEGSLQGCRSLDFLTEGVRAWRRFFAGHDLETTLVVDVHEPLVGPVRDELEWMLGTGELTQLELARWDKRRPFWNDHAYLDSLTLATGDFVAHVDQDCVGFRRPDCAVVDVSLAALSSGRYKYICQPTQVVDHGMEHASTRFFLTKRETLDIAEIRRALDPAYRRSCYGDKHTPCLEHILGLIAGPGSVLYPPADNGNYIVFSWVTYYAGLLARLNQMTYEEVHDYVFNKCGGVHGASDLIAQPLL